MPGKKLTWVTPHSPERTLPKRADIEIFEYLSSHHASQSLSRNQIQNLIENQCVVVDGKSIKPNSKISPGSTIEINIPPVKKLEILPEKMNLEFLYEDEHLAVVNKPQGMSVHPSGARVKGTLVNALLSELKSLSSIGGVERPGIVHRLDQYTSGVLLVTKTDLAHQKMAKIFANHDIKRAYWALCYGKTKFKSPTKVETLIGRNPKDRKKMSAQVKQGRNAVSIFTSLKTYQQFASWIKAELHTGRTHQVRVHLTEIGHSIMGDPLYGVPTSKQSKWTQLPDEIKKLVTALPGQALHARSLGFVHPILNKEFFFEAEPPKEFMQLVRTLGPYENMD